MKLHAVLATVMLGSLAASAQSAKPCEDLKSEIAQKLDNKGVKSYTLEVVSKEKDADGKVVGTCEGGTKKIVYRRAQPEDQAAAKAKDQAANAGR